VLDNIRVATPCRKDWNEMTGDERVRHCGDCNKHVYNLSGMTRDEAQALFVEKHGELCVRFYRRADGTILTADCPVGVRQKRKRRWIIAGATALLAGGGALAIGIERRAKTQMPTLGEIHLQPAPVQPTPAPDINPTMGAPVYEQGGFSAPPIELDPPRAPTPHGLPRGKHATRR